MDESVDLSKLFYFANNGKIIIIFKLRIKDHLT